MQPSELLCAAFNIPIPDDAAPLALTPCAMCAELITAGFPVNALIKSATSDIYSRLVAALVGTGDTEKLLTTDDTEWFVRMLDKPYFRTVMSMLAAYWRAVPDLMTPAEAAAIAGGGESTWRRRAASGKIPGAQKRGSQWLIPRSFIEPPDDDE